MHVALLDDKLQNQFLATLMSGILAGVLLRSKVVPTTLVSVWQDSNKVGFCTTIHDGTEWVVQSRKRLKGTSTSTAITKQPFYMFYPPLKCKEPYEHTHLLPIPRAIDNYN